MITASTSTAIRAVRLRIDGTVQGVGFRPFIYRLAATLGVRGWVANRNDGVVIHAEGRGEQIENFIDLIGKRAPPASLVVHIEKSPARSSGHKGFSIRESVPLSGRITGISPDLPVCSQCLEDMKKQPHRRGYLLVNCTECGPRFTIIRKLPYDRINTSMSSFPICCRCSEEYNDPGNRRFHAQPVGCNSCGPRYTMTAAGISSEVDFRKLAAIIAAGGILAVKGTGGFNLICDAAGNEAVARLRELKGRDRKPFAVMFGDIASVKRFCKVSNMEEMALTSQKRPVVVLQQRTAKNREGGSNELLETEPESGAGYPAGEAGQISSLVNCGLDSVGAILPYMPFHHMLFESGSPPALVFTSANKSGDPLTAVDDDAAVLYGGSSGALVSYNREIINPADDSVCKVAGGGIQILRRARGYVPEMITLPFDADGIFAAGSDLKNTFAMGMGSSVVLSQHNGDLENWKAFCRFKNNYGKFAGLFGFSPQQIACDLHPGYHSSRFAGRLARGKGMEPVRVQHHHAHIASCMAEHGITTAVSGVCMDGTGYGDDGNIWGSEFMICDYSGYERHGHLGWLPLPGGDAAVKEPWRTALASLHGAGHKNIGAWKAGLLSSVGSEKVETVEKMITGNINSPLSSGAGRLFDAVAALTGLCFEAGYDGEGPMLLESICLKSIDEGYDFSSGSLDVIARVMDDIAAGVGNGLISARFHNGLADHICKTVKRMNRITGTGIIVITGGVFQNSYLLNRVVQLLRQQNLTALTNRKVPVNDGGVSLGQLAIAASKR